jgi:homoserine O-succinyltransferase/O-acetyltransferase
MTVVLDTNRADGRAADELAIGLINNMPDAALEATEQQFLSLLDASSGRMTVRLRLLALPEVPRGDAGRQRLELLYSDIGELWTSRLDGLIVTGAEPCAADLRDEPYWTSLMHVLEWTEDNAVSAVWSCLAAHAVVLRLSGIRRRRSAEKCSGVFSCAKVGTHPLTEGIPAQFLVPHSRFNGLPEDEIVAAGFRVLARSPEVGVDMFVKDGNSPLLFAQGHPEYDAYTLLREYRRDIRRFLRGEVETYPSMPRGYFDEDSAANFREFREQALADRSEDTLKQLWASCPEPVLSNNWRASATRLYKNWLSLLAKRKMALTATELALELGNGHRDSRQAFQQ